MLIYYAKIQIFTGKDNDVFQNSERKLKSRFKKVDAVDITKWAKGHMAYYME